MKRIKTTLSFILSFVMLLCFLPHSVLAQIGEAFTSEENSALTDFPGSDTEVYVLGEVTENRTETSKTFRMSDGSYVAADYGKPIHFEDENGIWQDYDNTLAYSDVVTTSVIFILPLSNASNISINVIILVILAGDSFSSGFFSYKT